MKAGKLLFIFIVLVIGFNFVIGGILGKNGWLYNKSLEDFLVQREYVQDKVTVELNSLVQKQISLDSDKGLKDAAVRLGYYVEGENAFIFTDDGSQQPVFAGNIHDKQVVLFNYYSKGLCLALAVIPAVFVSFVIWLVSYLRNRDYDGLPEDSIEDGGFDDFRA